MTLERFKAIEDILFEALKKEAAHHSENSWQAITEIARTLVSLESLSRP